MTDTDKARAIAAAKEAVVEALAVTVGAVDGISLRHGMLTGIDHVHDCVAEARTALARAKEMVG